MKKKNSILGMAFFGPALVLLTLFFSTLLSTALMTKDLADRFDRIKNTADKTAHLDLLIL